MPPVTFRIYHLARQSAGGVIFNPLLKIAKVAPRGLKAKLVQDPGYVQTLRDSGLFALPRESVSVADAFKSGAMPPPEKAFGEKESDRIIKDHADQLVLATSANEAPCHYGQFTFNEEVADPLRSREALSGYPPENNGTYYCLAYSNTDGLAFKILQWNTEQPAISDAVVVSGKPLIWEGKETRLSDYLPSCLSDIRHVFRSPDIGGLPVISRRLAEIVRAGEADKLEKIAREGGTLSLNLRETQYALEGLCLPSEFKDVKEAFNAAYEEKWSLRGGQIDFPLIFNHYRHTFWAMLYNGEIMAGIISNEDRKTAQLGVTIPHLQQVLTVLDIKYALAFGAGKDNRLYFSAEEEKGEPRRIVDHDFRATTISGMLMLVSE